MTWFSVQPRSVAAKHEGLWSPRHRFKSGRGYILQGRMLYAKKCTLLENLNIDSSPYKIMDERTFSIIVFTLIAGPILVYIFLFLIWQMLSSLWALSPVTSIGFIATLTIAFIKRDFNFDWAHDFKMLVILFTVTIVSYIAVSIAKNAIGSLFAGNMLAAFIMIIAAVVIWLRGQELKNL